MRLFMIRHAHAGDRQPGNRDLYRPLTDSGRRRAEELVGLLAGCGIERVLSSPASRCVQTVEPLAEHLGIEVEEHPDLWEGTLVPHVLALLDAEGHRSAATVVCSHGDVIPEVVEAVALAGARVSGRGCAKGSIWVLERVDGAWKTADYLDPSAMAVPGGNV